jgi:hypothetical protein
VAAFGRALDIAGWDDGWEAPDALLAGAHMTPGPKLAAGDPVVVGFPEGCVVELTAGSEKALRGVVVGPTRYRFGDVPVYDVRLETGYVRPIREDYLRRIG